MCLLVCFGIQCIDEYVMFGNELEVSIVSSCIIVFFVHHTGDVRPQEVELVPWERIPWANLPFDLFCLDLHGSP